MTSTMSQHVEQHEDFTKAHAESWLRILGYAGHCACVGNVERCCANALDFVEPRMDDRETKEMLNRVERKI